MLSKKKVRNIFIFFLIIFSLIAVSFMNIFMLTITCSKYFCYYKKCSNFLNKDKMKCFLNETENIGEWIMLNFFSFLIYFSIITIYVIVKFIYKKIKNLYDKYNTIKILNEEKINDYYNESLNFDVKEIEELYTDEIDPLLIV